MTDNRDPLVLPQDEYDLVQALHLVQTVSPFNVAQRLRAAEGRLEALRDFLDDIAATVPEGEVAMVTVSRVLGIIGSDKGESRG